MYISPNTDFLTSGYDHRKKRNAQPENWDKMLKERDGETSGAEVQMFITPEGCTRSMSEAVEPRPWAVQPGHAVIEDPSLATPDQEVRGEVQIVARRGRQAQCVVTGLSEKRTWKELKGEDGGFTREGGCSSSSANE